MTPTRWLAVYFWLIGAAFFADAIWDHGPPLPATQALDVPAGKCAQWGGDGRTLVAVECDGRVRRFWTDGHGGCAWQLEDGTLEDYGGGVCPVERKP